MEITKAQKESSDMNFLSCAFTGLHRFMFACQLPRSRSHFAHCRALKTIEHRKFYLHTEWMCLRVSSVFTRTKHKIHVNFDCWNAREKLGIVSAHKCVHTNSVLCWIFTQFMHLEQNKVGHVTFVWVYQRYEQQFLNSIW